MNLILPLKRVSTPVKFKNLDLHDLFIETLAWIYVYGYINSRATNNFLHEFIISEKIIAGVSKCVFKVYLYMQKNWHV